jgi:hypothetical protein
LSHPTRILALQKILILANQGINNRRKQSKRYQSNRRRLLVGWDQRGLRRAGPPSSLTKKLEEATRSKKRQAAPFQKPDSQKKPKGLHRKSGRDLGHPLASKPIPETVDRTIEVPVNQRPDCNVDLKERHPR